MLATVRENLKGTLMIIVVIIFIVPMVISGVGTTFLGSVAGTDAASVNGETITNIDLDRAVRLRRSQIQAEQGDNFSSDQLSDEVLRTPVLTQLTRRLAVVTNGEKAGMGLSDEQFAEAVREQEVFFTDGKFDQQKYNTLLAQNGLTSAGFRDEVKSNLILRQQSLGLQLSSFITPSQVEQLIKLTHQKRSFTATKIPLSLVEEQVEIVESDLQTYYDENAAEFEVPQKLKVDYIELSVDKLASTIEVGDAEIREQYEAEIANFNVESNYEVAHILLEGENEEKAIELAEKIEAGEAFEELAKTYSDDIGSSEAGGSLGVLTAGMFPEEFENAVYELEQGQVSGAVKTDAGTHFIKVVNKSKTELPSFEGRKAAISEEISKARAADEFSSLVDSLGELTYFSEGLEDASQQLGLPIQQSSFFDANSGSGIADSPKVRNAAFDEKVLSLGNNSNTIEIDGQNVVVLRLAERKEAYVKALDEVLPLVEDRVKKQKISDMLAELAKTYQSEVEANANAQSLAEEKGYEFESHELVKRTDFSINPETLTLAFSAETPSATVPSYNSQVSRDGGYLIVTVTSAVEGTLADLDDAEKQGFEAQVSQQLANFDGASYEASVIEGAKIDIR